MKLFSYVVRWDHGFAPNPFHGVCSLATCKPGIRKKAEVGDWVLGTGSAEKGYQGRAIFLMQVTEILEFNGYWTDPRFLCKRPLMNGSLKQRFGDNIYSRDKGGHWSQADSRHSYDQQANERNLKRDTGTTERILLSVNFIYWGEEAPIIPKKFAKIVIARPGYTYDFTEEEILEFIDWASQFQSRGQIGAPLEWRFEARWR